MEQALGDGREHLLQGKFRIFPVDVTLDVQVGCSTIEMLCG